MMERTQDVYECRVTSRIILALHSTAKEDRVVEILEVEEEVEDLVEVMKKLYVTTMDNKATTREIVEILLPPVSTVTPLIM